MSRYEKLCHLIQLIDDIEGVVLPLSHFDGMTDAVIDAEIEFKEYLLFDK